jgi:phospholipid/cholesterol/gamma-HCH transport system substrate-binding protein
MTIARGAAIGCLIAAVIAVAVLMFGSGGGTDYVVRMQTGNQLVNGNEVKVGGLPVGKIKSIKLSEDNQAEVKITVNEDFSPLHQGTTAIIRQTSLPSVANRYIALSPGPNNAPEIPDGGELTVDETTNNVDIDQLFNIFDPKTRKGLQQTLQGFAGWYAGQSENLALSYKYLGPSLRSVSDLLKEISRDQDAFTSLIVNGAKATSAVASRRDDLAALVSNGNAFAQALASENESLDQALEAFPGALEEGSVAFRNLRRALVPLTELNTASKENTQTLPAFLSRLARLFRTMREPFIDLREIVDLKGPGNDAVDQMRQQPSLTNLAKKSVANNVKALKSGQPIIEFLRPYAPDISSWIAHFAQVPAYYDANGHYARVLPIFSAFSYDQPSNTINSLSPGERQSQVKVTPNRFCPGAATQPAPDGSNPFLDDGKLGFDDCDPAARPPGP